MVVAVTFPLFLVAAALWDVRTRRIPNLLTSLFALAGLVVSASGTGPASLRSGCIAGGISLVAGMAMYAMRVIGGGDVKLFAAAALWLGLSATVTASLATAIVGGVAALYFFRIQASRPVLNRSADVLARLRLDDGPDVDRVPYGVAIAAGCLWAWWPQIGPLLGAP